MVLDFRAFHWLEDEEEIIGHPRDPFHRIDVRSTLRRVEVMLDGVKLADTVGAQLLYETAGARYAGPDVTARLDPVRLTQDGPDRVRVEGVRGEAPPPTLKVGVSRLIP